MKRLALGLLLSTVACASSEPHPRRQVEDTQWIMGTALRVVAELDSTDASARLARLFESASTWEQWLSHYRDDSVVAELQRHAPAGVPVPQSVREYFERSQSDRANTDGSFDIFHRSPDVSDAWSGLRLSEAGTPPTVALATDAVVDPGGNGKGFAVASMVDSLRAWHVERALIDFGGSSWAAVGRPSHAVAWTIDVVDSDSRELGRVALADAALSISQTRLRGSRTREHIEDPTSGELIQVARCALVRSPSSVDAEVLSTALIVRGVGAFEFLPKYPDASAVLIEGDTVHRSDACAWFTATR